MELISTLHKEQKRNLKILLFTLFHRYHAQITGDWDDSIQNFNWGDLMQIIPALLRHVSKFKAPECLHCNARRGHGKNTAQKSPKHAIVSEKFIFPRFLPGGRGTPPHTHPSPQRRFLDPRLCSLTIPAILTGMLCPVWVRSSAMSGVCMSVCMSVRSHV